MVFSTQDRVTVLQWATFTGFSITTNSEKKAIKTAFDHAFQNLSQLRNDPDKEQFILAFNAFSKTWVDPNELSTARKVCIVMASSIGALSESDFAFLDSAIKEENGLQDLGFDAKLDYLAKRPEADIKKLFTKDQISKMSDEQLLFVCQFCERGSIQQWKDIRDLCGKEVDVLNEDLTKLEINEKLEKILENPNRPLDKLFTTEQLKQLDAGKLLIVFKWCDKGPLNRMLLKNIYQPSFFGKSYADMLLMIQEDYSQMTFDERVYVLSQNPEMAISSLFSRDELLNCDDEQFKAILSNCSHEQVESLISLCDFTKISHEKYDNKKLAILEYFPEVPLAYLYTSDHLDEYADEALCSMLAYCDSANRVIFKEHYKGDFSKIQRMLPLDVKLAILEEDSTTPINELFTSFQLKELGEMDRIEVFNRCYEAGPQAYLQLKQIFPDRKNLGHLDKIAKMTFIKNHPEVPLSDVFTQKEVDGLYMHENEELVKYKIDFFRNNPTTPVGNLFTTALLRKMSIDQLMELFEICGMAKQYGALKALYQPLESTLSFSEMVDATKVNYFIKNPTTLVSDIFPDSEKLMRLNDAKLLTVFKLCKDDNQLQALKELYKTTDDHPQTFEEMVERSSKGF